MLAQAIGLLTGAQPVAGMVGPYGDEAYVEAEFDAPADLFDDPALAAVAGLRPDGEDALVVARRLTAAGRSRAFVWGRGCARADLEALGERLIEMSSQHEARRLARPARQLELLDAHAGTGELAAEMAGGVARRSAPPRPRSSRRGARPPMPPGAGSTSRISSRGSTSSPRQPGSPTRSGPSASGCGTSTSWQRLPARPPSS